MARIPAAFLKQEVTKAITEDGKLAKQKPGSTMSSGNPVSYDYTPSDLLYVTEINVYLV